MSFQEHRILLTGTPLQNNVDELFSLLNFLEPAQFPSQGAFLMEFGNLKTEAQVERLQAVSRQLYLARNVDSNDVLSEILFLEFAKQFVDLSSL